MAKQVLCLIRDSEFSINFFFSVNFGSVPLYRAIIFSPASGHSDVEFQKDLENAPHSRKWYSIAGSHVTYTK